MKIYLIATQIIYFASLLPWLLLWGAAAILISHAYNTENLFVFSLTTIYPVVVVVCSISAWYFHTNKKTLSILINLIPLIWIIVYYVYIFSISR